MFKLLNFAFKVFHISVSAYFFYMVVPCTFYYSSVWLFSVSLKHFHYLSHKPLLDSSVQILLPPCLILKDPLPVFLICKKSFLNKSFHSGFFFSGLFSLCCYLAVLLVLILNFSSIFIYFTFSTRIQILCKKGPYKITVCPIGLAYYLTHGRFSANFLWCITG